MSTWRRKGAPCPLPNVATAEVEVCWSCKYMRGMAGISREHSEINCNWPRNGSDIDPNPPSWTTDVAPPELTEEEKQRLIYEVEVVRKGNES